MDRGMWSTGLLLRLLLLVILLLFPYLGSVDALVHGNGTDGPDGSDEPSSSPRPERILSRKRRYLTFPEGSSFQVVYDQTIPMLGAERLFTIGITVALAYELPSITFDQIEQMIVENANEGAGGAAAAKLDLNANQTVLIDSRPDRKNILSYSYAPPNQSPPMGYYGGGGGGGGGGRINYYTNNYDNGNRRYDKYDQQYGNRQRQPASRWEQFVSSELPGRLPTDGTGNDFGSLVNRYLTSWIRRHPPNYPMAKKRFYPVFGKRSIREDTAPLDRHFLRQHRTTRHALYERIETFLTAKGKHGHHCVLRALCESGQRQNDTEPDTFLKEILRAIFSLPATHEEPDHHKHRLYDEAHAHRGNCAETYSYCEDSFWSSDFVF
ncbi:uncharacterized protein LOC126572941 [Anopheles aquasalis]|uniref:uncharacterized protein LOC126572941 n=1 Tax=Anopheles aquasalis TaxID=42839 RepID=UPI00215B6EBF|nr:uncharacterized protein LOC126572941 [Anopheles aquasalis]